MTSNKYQKYNESIRLSEEAKEDILNQVLAADIKPARRTVPGWRWAAVFAFGLAVFAFLIIPRSKVYDAEPAIVAESAARDESVAETELTDAAPAEAVLSAETLSEELGYRIPDMNGYAQDMTASYERVSASQACITLSGSEKTITIVTSSPQETKVQAAGENGVMEEAVSEALAAEDADRIVEWNFEADGIAYRITFDPPVSQSEAEELEAAVRENLR